MNKVEQFYYAHYTDGIRVNKHSFSAPYAVRNGAKPNMTAKEIDSLLREWTEKWGDTYTFSHSSLGKAYTEVEY